MYHGVPMAGDFSHGLISYHPKFFTRLQEVNGYEIIDRWIWADSEAGAADVVGRVSTRKLLLRRARRMRYQYRCSRRQTRRALRGAD